MNKTICGNITIIIKLNHTLGYKVPQLAKDLVHFSDLLLVFQVDWSIEVRNFVFFCCALTYNVIFTRMHELSQCCGIKEVQRHGYECKL